MGETTSPEMVTPETLGDTVTPKVNFSGGSEELLEGFMVSKSVGWRSGKRVMAAVVRFVTPLALAVRMTMSPLTSAESISGLDTAASMLVTYVPKSFLFP